MKTKEKDLKEKLLNDPMYDIIMNLTEEDMDEINEVSVSVFDKSIDDINNPLAVRGLWEKGLNRKLTSIFVNLIKNINTYVVLNDTGSLQIDVDKQHNIIITITDFFMNDYNFEMTVMDNNTREFTFYYAITDKSADDNSILIKGKFDINISVMYLNKENYEDITGEELSSDVGYELGYEIFNKIFFNRYITEDYMNTDSNEIMNKEIMLLESIFDDLDNEKIKGILSVE